MTTFAKNNLEYIEIGYTIPSQPFQMLTQQAKSLYLDNRSQTAINISRDSQQAN